MSPKIEKRRAFVFIFVILTALLPASRVRADDLRVDVVVDVTAEGKKILRPTPEKPAFYLPLPAGYTERGKVLVHYQRPPPSAPEVQRLVTEALAKQGYLTATKPSPPSLVLIYWWGYIAPEFIGSQKSKKLGRGAFVNEVEMLSMVGGETVDTKNTYDPRMQEVIASSRHPRYYLLVSAFDYQAWLQHNSVLLWRAHVSCAVWHHYLDQVLPTLINTGVPLFGQETAVPVLITTPNLGRVMLGEPVVKTIPAAPPPASRP